ncbi:TRAP transporter small permease [Xanthobacter sp. KR7-65]|uniref:TRAP transporter small permease n=1 Tax=Xanthobacter sp. KR7-65 TaxID=3156612 RepID=UPI0032B40A13
MDRAAPLDPFRPERGRAPAASASFSLARLCRAVDAGIAAGARTVMVAAFVALFATVTIEVCVRYFTASSLPWASEMPDLLFPWATMAGIVLAAQWGQHMAVEFLLRMMPMPAVRITAAAGHAIAAACFLFLAWTGLEVLEITAGEHMPVTRISSAYAYLSMVLGFLLLGVTSLTAIPRAIAARDPLACRTPPFDIEEGGAG